MFFVVSVSPIVSLIIPQQQGLAVYCGEEGGERSTSILLKVLCKFATSLESAVKKYDDRINAQERKKAAIEKAAARENKKKRKKKETEK